MRKKNMIILIIAMIIPLLIGSLSAALSSSGMAAYGSMKKPPLSPPALVFPVAWTILYLMMGIASYYIAVAYDDQHEKLTALLLYALQLTLNFAWSIIFFNWNQYFWAFIWLLVLLCIVILCAFQFFIISRKAAYLLIPYILWLTFAGYLNLGTYIVN